MAITAAEQYMIELLNRARLDPLGEAARQGKALNAGLPATFSGIPFDRIDTGPKQVLAPTAVLDRAATGHSKWMADSGRFSHVGNGNSAYDHRIVDAGFVRTGSWSLGENLAFAPTSYTPGTAATIRTHFTTLWNSAVHRSNMMDGSNNFREVGIAEVAGRSGDYLTMNLAYQSARVYVTGVAYADRDGNGFYSMGEGVSGLGFSAGARSAGSWSAIRPR